jgi:hypothetical protein
MEGGGGDEGREGVEGDGDGRCRGGWGGRDGVGDRKPWCGHLKEILQMLCMRRPYLVGISK